MNTYVYAQEQPSVETLNAYVDDAQNIGLLRGNITAGDNLSVFFVFSQQYDRPTPLPTCADLPSDDVIHYQLPGTYNSGAEFSFTVDSLTDGTNYYYRACAHDNSIDNSLVQGSIKSLGLIVDGLPGPESEQIIPQATTSQEIPEPILEVEPETIETVQEPETEIEPTPEPSQVIEPETTPEPILQTIDVEPQVATTAEPVVTSTDEELTALEVEQGVNRVTDQLAQENRDGVLSVVIDQRVQAIFPNENGDYEYQTQFGNDELVEILVPGVALGIEAGQAVVIAIAQQAPKRGVLPDETYSASMQTQYMYDIRAFLLDGTEVTQFNKRIELVISIPELLQSSDDLGVYFVNEQFERWDRVDDVVFSEQEARFLVDHLTIFAIWEIENQPEIMKFDDGFVNCRLVYGYVPWCFPWPWVYAGVFLFVVVLAGFVLRRRN